VLQFPSAIFGGAQTALKHAGDDAESVDSTRDGSFVFVKLQKDKGAAIPDG